jgi:hypothetical protein
MYQKVALTVELIIKFLDASYKDNPDLKIDDYKLVSIDKNDDHLNMNSYEKQYVKVYYNEKLKHCVVVHRGTAPPSSSNYYSTSDTLFAECAMELCPLYKTCSPPGIEKCKYKDTRRFKVSEMIQKWAEKKYSQWNVTTLGHSQGGLLAALVGQNSKEIIKIQPLHRETYQDTEIEITIRSVNDFIDKRNVIKDKTIVESNPSTHMYVHINNPKEKVLFHDTLKQRYGMDYTEHGYTDLFAEFTDKKMQIGKDVFNEDQCMVPSTIEQHKGLLQYAESDKSHTSKSEKSDTSKSEKSDTSKSEKNETPEKSDNLITLIKYIGTGAVIIGSMYVGYKWLNNRTSKKKGCRSASRKVSKVRSRRKLSSKMSRH